MTGIELIAQERKEQIEKHGRTVEQDVMLNGAGQLACAASFLACKDIDVWDVPYVIPTRWDMEIWDRMVAKPHRERLIIAGALIAAELDRLNSIGQ